MAWLVRDDVQGECGYPCEQCRDACELGVGHPANHWHGGNNVSHAWRYATARNLKHWRPF